MAQIRHGPAILVYLMEHEIAEELDEVAVARFGPAGVVVESGVSRGEASVESRLLLPLLYLHLQQPRLGRGRREARGKTV